MDFVCIEHANIRPNYITTKSATGEIVLLSSNPSESIDGKIVVIEKADPGYDWIFSQRLAGLITKYGGVASHMAIRCAEFSIPAALGCGNELYAYVAKSKKIILDCKNEQIQRVN